MTENINNEKGTWVDFCSSIIIILCLPLLPLLFEKIIRTEITLETLTLTIAIYTITLGTTSANKLFFSFSIFMGLILIFEYTYALTKNVHYVSKLFISTEITLLIVILAQCMERYRIHIIEGKKFFIFK